MIRFVVLRRYIIYWVFLVTAECFKNDGCPELVKKTKYYSDIYKDKCYLFVNTEKFWGPAAQYCLDMGGDLISITSDDIQQYVMDKLWSRELGWGNNGVWIGARYYEDRGWIWTTGEQVKYNNWAPGQPGKFMNLISFENCAAMKRGDNWKWHDFHCSLLKFHYKFICQFPIAQSMSQGGIDNGNTLILVVVISLAVLMILVMLIIFVVYRRQQVKHTRELPAVRFDNLSYAQLHAGQQNIDNANRSRPSSNIYLTPSEVNSPYSEATPVHDGNCAYSKNGHVRSDPLPPLPTERSDASSSVGGEEQGACGGRRPSPSASDPLIVSESKPNKTKENRMSNEYVDMKSVVDVKAGGVDLTGVKEVDPKKAVDPVYCNIVNGENKVESPYEILP